MFHPQGNFYPQGSFYPQLGAGYTPVASPPSGFGVPQQIPAFAQGLSHSSNLLQSALLQQAIQQLLAPQQAAQPFGTQNPAGFGGVTGLTNGALPPSVGAWPQQVTHQPPHHVLQQLAQIQYLIAQQLAQLAQFAAQQVMKDAGSPYAGQFIPGQMGANFAPGFNNYVPGITTH